MVTVMLAGIHEIVVYFWSAKCICIPRFHTGPKNQLVVGMLSNTLLPVSSRK